MKPIKMWALTDGKRLLRDWEGVPILFKTKESALDFLDGELMKPIKVIITEAPK